MNFKKMCKDARLAVCKKSQNNHYPCLCEAIGIVIFWCKITGILTITSVKNNQFSNCTFKTSVKWVVYSRVVQVLFFAYICFVYGSRLLCPNESTDQEWYVMTFGYFIADLETLIAIVFGSLHSSKICSVLEKLSKMNESITETKKLKKKLNIIIRCFLAYFCILVVSHILIAYQRWQLNKNSGLISCTSLDATLAVIIRGLTIIFPTTQMILVTLIIFLIGIKFRTLAETLQMSLEQIKIIANSDANVPIKASSSKSILPKEDKYQALEQISTCHKELFDILQNINECIGFQLLISVTSTLYSTIYYLYRYNITRWSDFKDNFQKVHYILGLLFRLLRLLFYMFLGQNLIDESIKPLKVLQRVSVINLPVHLQQQIQTLILQWTGKTGYLSAFNVVTIGPWLLAPIIGNVITYLLVALQFEQNNKNYINTNGNFTILLETVE